MYLPRLPNVALPSWKAEELVGACDYLSMYICAVIRPGSEDKEEKSSRIMYLMQYLCKVVACNQIGVLVLL
jgi:hypothetical protein